MVERTANSGEGMPRNLVKRGPVWYFRKEVAGTQKWISLETPNLRIAEERRDKLLAEIKADGGVKWGDKRSRTFNTAAERFGREHFKNLKPKTRKRYLVSIANLLEEFDRVSLSDITSSRLYDFEIRRAADNVSGSTIIRDLACLSSIFTLAEVWEWADRNPVKSYMRGRAMQGLTDGEPRTRYLSQDEEQEVLACAAPKALKAIIFAIETGLRKTEQFSMLRADIDKRSRQIMVRGEIAKNHKQRTVPLFERALAVLDRMPADLRSPYLFVTKDGHPYSGDSPTHYEALQKAVRRANASRLKVGRAPMAHVEWHDLRRTCGCRLLQDRKFSMEEVSRWLGHSSIKVTEKHYAFLNVEQLHRAVARTESRVVPLPERKP